MRPQRWTSSPVRGAPGKVVVLILIAALGMAGAEEVSLDRGESAWRDIERGQEVDPARLRGLESARTRWLADTNLRELEETDPDGATAAYLEQLPRAEAAHDSVWVLVALERLAILDIDARRVAEARPRLERCRRLAMDIGQPMALALADLNLGRVLLRTREVELAAEHLAAAREAAIALELPRWHGDAALAQSVVARLSMDLDEALVLREEAYVAYTEAGHLPGRARALHYIGTTYAMRGELTTAMVKLQAAEELARESGSDDVLSGCLGDQAGILFLTGDYDGASARYREASDLTDDPRRKGWYLSNLASILAEQERHAEALPRYEEALELLRASADPRMESTILLAIGQSRCALGDMEQGLADLDAAVAHAREYQLPLDEAMAIEVKGHALVDEGRLDEAQPLLADAAARADQLGYFDLQASAHKGLAEIARRQGRLAEAQAQLEQAVDTVVRVRRRSGGSASVQSGFFGEVNEIFDALVAVLYERHEREPGGGHDVRAWEVAQQSRARWLLDLLAEAEVDLRVRADQSYQERETAVLEAIAALEERRASAPDSTDALDAEIRRHESRLDVLEAELRAADPRYADLRYPLPITLDHARSEVLVTGEAVLEFQLGEHHSHLWLVSRDRFVFRRLPPREEIEDRVRRLLPLLHDPDLTGDAAAWYTAAARPVASDLLDPVLSELKDVHRLIVVPDGLLHYLPLEALPVRDSGAAGYHDVPWLANEVDVVVTPSVSALARLRALPPLPVAARPLLLVADPDLPRPEAASVFVRAAGADGLAPVPGAAAEQQRLLDLYGDGVQAWSGAEATAARLAPSGSTGAGWRSVHLITHGLINEDRPQYSGLVLAPTATSDGFLDVAEIFALDLDCNQVVLSACSSALGRSVDGEGLVGLSQAFLYAGARSVVAALGDVGGEGAARFMGDYHALLVGDPEASRSAALAATKRSFAGDAGRTDVGVALAHPNVWAAFTAIGDAR